MRYFEDEQTTSAVENMISSVATVEMFMYFFKSLLNWPRLHRADAVSFATASFSVYTYAFRLYDDDVVEWNVSFWKRWSKVERFQSYEYHEKQSV